MGRLAALAVLSLAFGTTGHPGLRFASVDPVKVRGTGFYAHERVRVTLQGPGGTRMRVVNSSRTGSFVVTFSDLAASDRCNDAYYVRARGARGDRAAAKLPLPECAPA